MERRVESRKDFFDHHASSWDAQRHYEGQEEHLSCVVESFGLSEGDYVLDVGTGTGVLLPFIRGSIGPRGRLIAMDFSFRMLAEVKRRPFPKTEALINASVEAIPFQSNEFDEITCFSSFPHFPNKAKALLEMVRVLKPGGVLSIAHLKSAEEINEFHRHVGGPVSQDHLPPPDKLLKLMEDSGLEEVVIVNQPGKFLAKGRKQ
jgi:ubiquinone/menaquinone biosynthesis C-methylase UbiE